MYICKYCRKECKNLNSLVQHEIRCKLNPNKLDMSYIKPGHSKGHKGGNQYTYAKEHGLEKPILSEESKYKIGSVWRGKSLSNDIKAKISLGMQNAVKKYPDSYNASNVNGRVKHFTLNGFKIDGSWELLVATYLTKNNINWIKPNNGFEYIWNDSIHIYYPDFYLPDYDRYIEVKGYERDRDRIKYTAVNNLIIIKQSQIKKIQLNTFDIFNYI